MGKSKFHVSSSGELAVCSAGKRACPRGGMHYSAGAKARIEAGKPRGFAERDAVFAINIAKLKVSEKVAREELFRLSSQIDEKYSAALTELNEKISVLDNGRLDLKDIIARSDSAAIVNKAKKTLGQLEVLYAKHVADRDALSQQYKISKRAYSSSLFS